ncbi:hypothetical protein Nepgr_018440 [Nepenthes gracilis]|uniref:Uncharacterized protein n=1 Tax=Nepenthes gracilis TaxID=150966 RepID=A0AAD3STF3_NEPGR|nr:hypothetical protein Nepgr_018440 [Nepenthes gracilis]
MRDFSVVGDGATDIAAAFEKAVSPAAKFRNKGVAQLNVPDGHLLTASFNLTSHVSLFLAQDAVIVESMDYELK